MLDSLGDDLRQRALLCGLALLAIVASGCDSLLGTDQAAFADEARVSVEGTSTVALLLVTSTIFTAQPDPDTGQMIPSLVQADTALVSGLPHDAVYSIQGADRFLVQLINPESESADIHIRVFFDDRLVYNELATMQDASLTYFSFFEP